MMVMMMVVVIMMVLIMLRVIMIMLKCMSTEKAPRSFSTGTYGVNMRSVKEAKIIIPRCYTQTWPTLFVILCKLIVGIVMRISIGLSSKQSQN